MSILGRRHIWIAADIRRGVLQDADTRTDIQFFRGNDIAVHVSFWDGTKLLSVSNLAQAVLTVRNREELESAPLMMKAQVALNGALTQAQWRARSAEHALFEFIGAETNLDLLGRVFRDFYVGLNVDTLDTPGRDLCYGTGILRIVEDARHSGDIAPEVPEEHYTTDQSDARYPLRSLAEYSVSGASELRTLTAESSVDDLYDVLMTLIADLKTTGVIQ